jgi:putative holliday junction resolvase
VRALGLDLGTKRIGVAVSDRSGTVASPLVVVQRSGSVAADHRRLAQLVIEEEAEIVVVGMPWSLSGAAGRAAQAANAEIAALTSVLTVPVVSHDERFTTRTAQEALREGGVKRAKQRAVVDKVAAAVMLQAWLDARGHQQ